MISFYPGPSRVHNEVPKWVFKAHLQGYLSTNHRSEKFRQLVSKTQKLLRKNLKVPADYGCFFVSSATECWEIIAQSLIRESSLHIYNGAFGEKWFNYSQKIKPKATAFSFDFRQPLPLEDLQFDLSPELIALTQNETSNGTQIQAATIESLNSRYADALIALDVTSSLGGLQMPWEYGDIWFGSVQKCLGLPAGMAILICSPRALEVSGSINEHNHYNSLNNIAFHMSNHQTTHTPNVLNIYLLKKVLQKSGSIKKVHKRIEKRFTQWMKFISSLNLIKPLIAENEVQSRTVITLEGAKDDISMIMQESADQGFILGMGYGILKETTLRIANFPAMEKDEIQSLQKFWKHQGY